MNKFSSIFGQILRIFLKEVFSGQGHRSEAANEAQIKELHAKIGQLIVERDFLVKAFAR